MPWLGLSTGYSVCSYLLRELTWHDLLCEGGSGEMYESSLSNKMLTFAVCCSVLEKIGNTLFSLIIVNEENYEEWGGGRNVDAE